MNIGFFTDTHIRIDTPCGRTDDFKKAILLKLEVLGDMWREYKVDLILFGGDLFHTPDPATSIIYDTMHILKLWGRNIIGIIGSHDYFGYQPKSLKRTGIGLLQKAGIIELIGNEGNSKDYVNDSSFLRVVGTSHCYGLCDDITNFFEPKLSHNHFQIQLVHGDLLDKPVLWNHVLCRNVKTESDLVLSGHYHPGWLKPLTYGNTTFINPGSIGRLETSLTPRYPRVLIINSETRKVNFVQVPNCEVHPFYAKTDAEEVDIMQDVTKLISMIEKTEVDIVNVKEQLPSVAQELNFSIEVVEKAFELLEKVDN